MLRAFAGLTKMSIGAADGEIGAIKDAYFDDREWALRYIVVATGGWLTGARVLVTPHAIRGVDWSASRVDVTLTREQVRRAPSMDADKPVSRQNEIAYFDYYGHPYYWSGPFMWGEAPLPLRTGATSANAGKAHARRDESRQGDPNLRSTNEVSGYHIEATDGGVGHVEDFLFDDEDWSLRYFIVDTRNWLPGRKVLISTDWIERVSWEARKVYVAMPRRGARESAVRASLVHCARGGRIASALRPHAGAADSARADSLSRASRHRSEARD
jgi:hypothetical protein